MSMATHAVTTSRKVVLPVKPKVRHEDVLVVQIGRISFWPAWRQREAEGVKAHPDNHCVGSTFDVRNDLVVELPVLLVLPHLRVRREAQHERRDRRWVIGMY